jgi:hypothetical protein
MCMISADYVTSSTPNVVLAYDEKFIQIYNNQFIIATVVFVDTPNGHDSVIPIKECL